ncbi:MAG: F0F1 ATP synthase subunit B [Candidatus Omnitrophica bacterium]|nr:F0F1 ATP synthase subunit B [Candidatus Omnitrophota bacterium]
MELLKFISTNEVIAQIISFLILFFILRKFFWRKALSFLDARRGKISQEIKDADKLKAEALQLAADYQAKLNNIEAEAHKRIQEAISEGRKIDDQIRKKAYEEAQDIINNAKASIRHELSLAKEQLKEEIVDLTIEATSMVFREKLTEETDKKLVNDFLERLDEVQ